MNNLTWVRSIEHTSIDGKYTIFEGENGICYAMYESFVIKLDGKKREHGTLQECKDACELYELTRVL
jgi:hypothetical protein